MSEVPHTRKPDRKFYRHPRYNNPDTHVKSFNSQSGQPICAPIDASESKYGNDHFHRPRGGQSQSGGRGFTRSAPTRKKQPDQSLNSAYNIHEPAKPATESASKVLERPYVKNTTQAPVTSNTESPAPSSKHGGLIHLPKDIHLYENPDEPKLNPMKPSKRDTHTYANKPVVVVRPSFPQSRQRQESESSVNNLWSSRSTVQHANDGKELAGSKMSTTSQLAWDETAEAAFRFFFNGFNQLEQNSQQTSIPPGSSVGSVISGPSVGPRGPGAISETTRPPNETVLMTVQQIVQLDGTLNSLLVPPGLCAAVLSQLHINFEKDAVDRSDAECLLLRWWQAVQKLREHLFNLFESVILTDLDFCNSAHVEQGMWKSVFYTVLELLRSWISNPDSMRLLQVKKSPNSSDTSSSEESKITSLLQKMCLSDVIATGETRLNSLLERIQAIHRVPLAGILADGRPPPETRSRTRRLVYLSCQKLMLFLGDLARYKEILTGERNFGKARSWYHKAQLLIPKNGRSYNQLAVLAVYTSRHLDAMYFYMRTLAASNPFPTASQSLAALFNEVSPRAESLIQQIQKPKLSSSNAHEPRFGGGTGRFQRLEIWVHPLDGQTTVIQGSRRLTYPSSYNDTHVVDMKTSAKCFNKVSSESDTMVENEDEEDEEAQAELEEYANMSLIELSKQFGLTFLHAHGKLFTKIGMETFPEVASLTLQALSGLLAQNPCPLSAERLCQLCIVNMYNVDRAMSLTSHATQLASQKATLEQESSAFTLQPIGRITGVETLRSVHHDHAARFGLDTFSLLCRRAAQLLQQTPPPGAPSWWLPQDVRLILPALRLWSEWMILHPEHWLPPPNHRDPVLRPCLNDWQLIADLCTRAASWLARCPDRPEYEECTPTTSLIQRIKEGVVGEHSSAESTSMDFGFDAAFLFEESLCAGFKPMLDLIPKMYRYTGKWAADTVSDFVRIDKLVLFGDFLCGIDSPVLQYDVDRAIYESVVERESSERRQDRQSTHVDAEPKDRSSSGSEPGCAQLMSTTEVPDLKTEPADNEASADILALQRQRAKLQRQLEEEQRLITWRRNAIRQAASGGYRAVELEVRPIYLLPDTNCYIDWLEGIATLAQRSSNYTVLVPIVVVNELDALARPVNKHLGNGRTEALHVDDAGEVTRAGLIQERARAAIAYLEDQFAQRSSRLRALTAKGSFLETIAYRTEVNGGRDPGQINDDVILTCCTHFFKEDPDLFRSSRGLDQNLTSDGNTQPIRIFREIVLLTSDRNLRLKAVNINLPARPLRTFVNWSRLPLITQIPKPATEPGLARNERKNEFPKLQPRGQWKQPLKH